MYESSFAIVLVHTITTSIQGSKCFYQQKWITVQLLSSNGPSHLFWLIQEQLNYPSGSASSGYILIVYIHSVVEIRMLRWIYGHTRMNRVRNDNIRDRLEVAPIKEKLVQH